MPRKKPSAPKEKAKLGRFDAKDFALFPEIDSLITGGKSCRAATLILAQQGKIDGLGTSTPENRAKRLERVYKRERARPTILRIPANSIVSATLAGKAAAEASATASGTSSSIAEATGTVAASAKVSGHSKQ